MLLPVCRIREFRKRCIYLKNKRKNNGELVLNVSGFTWLLWKEFHKFFHFTVLTFLSKEHPPKQQSWILIQVPTEQIPVLLSSVLRGETGASVLDFVDHMTWILVTGLLVGQMKASEVDRFLKFECPYAPLLRSLQNTAVSDNDREPTSVPTKMKLSEANASINTCVLIDIRRLSFSDSCNRI
jgi:hypothetical protein